MPRTTSPKRHRAPALDKLERRGLLLRCAVRVFARRGLGAGRHAEIAREAKVSVPTVFFYFPTRAALVQAVLEEVARFFAEITERIHNSERAAPEIILEHGWAFADAVMTHGDYTRVLLEWSTALRDETWPLYLQFQERNFEIIARTIRRWRLETGRGRVENADDDARVIGAAGYMLAQMRLTRVPTARIERFLQNLVGETLGDGQYSQAIAVSRPRARVAEKSSTFES